MEFDSDDLRQTLSLGTNVQHCEGETITCLNPYRLARFHTPLSTSILANFYTFETSEENFCVRSRSFSKVKMRI